MRYVTIKEIRALDRAAIDERGIPAATLMERAGKAVADAVMARVTGGPVIVLCGYGNNGGDGFVAARYLVGAGYRTAVFLVGTPRAMSAETARHREKLRAIGLEADTVASGDDLEKIDEALREGILIIDAVFGVGARGPLSAFYTRLIEAVNAAGRPVIAVDVPSGLDADSGTPYAVAVKATATVTMGYPKAGFKAPEAKEYLGELIVADIGI